MSFASPAFMIGLALIPVLLGLYVRTERRPLTFAPAQLLPYEKLGSKVGTKRVKREVTSSFAAAGLVLLLGGLGTGLRWRGRLP